MVNRGFALPMTLVLLALIAGSIMTMARHSARQATTARTALNDAQRRWAELSVQATLLPRCAQLIDDGSDRHDLTLTLGGMRLDLRIADERRKLDFNRAWAVAPTEAQRQELVQRLEAIDRTLVIRAKPNRRGTAGFSGFDQLIEGFDPDAAFGESVPGAVSLWGEGYSMWMRTSHAGRRWYMLSIVHRQGSAEPGVRSVRW